MVWIRTAALVAVSALSVYGVVRSASNENEALYSGGTLKSIPSDTRGSLDMTGSTELRFEYGKSTYRLPYSQIRGVHFTKAAASRKKIAHVPIPAIPGLRRPQILDLSFVDEGGGIGTASFRLIGKAFDSAEWTLSERMKPESKSAAGAARTKLPEAWWGDRYWKTTRNRAAWPEGEIEPPVSLAGGK